MKRVKRLPPRQHKWLTAAALAAGLLAGAGHAQAETYAVELVAPQGKIGPLNNAGVMVGVNRTVGFCPNPYPSCYSIDTVVAWKPKTNRPVPLPAPAGLPDLAVSGINRAGWITGTASFGGVDFKPEPVVWRPNSAGYTVEQLGLLPGNNRARVAGIDNFNRVVGYATSSSFPPVNAAPFMWTPTGGLTNLTTMGFPNDIPLSISGAGTVGLNQHWYKLDVPGTVTPNAPLPAGFTNAEAGGQINDAGDQARFLITGGSQNVAYLFRYIASTTLWQQLHPAGTGRLASYGTGSIDNRRNVTGTVLSTGVFAPGPTGFAQSLTDLLSPAYAGVSVVTGGTRNANGMIAAKVGIGRSAGRVARLVPIHPCTTSCARVAALVVKARSVTSCDSTNLVTARLIVRDENNTALPGITVSGRFLDEYYLNKKVTGITAGDGSVRFVHRGPACVGAVSFFVDNVTASGRSFDRFRGKLTDYAIPAP